MSPASAIAPIRVVVVEDSPTQRAVLRRTLEAEGDIVVVGEATTAAGAVAAVRAGAPDVVTVDLQIPGGGEHAIERIMADVPCPILVLSAMLENRQASAGALGLGAAGVLAKPRRWDQTSEHALRCRVRSLRAVPSRRRQEPLAPPSRPVGAERATTTPIVAIASSTGGPAALTQVLPDLKGTRAAVLVVQHIGTELAGKLADWLGRVTGLPVTLAEHGAPLTPGTVAVGPGGRHLTVDGRGHVALVPGGSDVHQPAADRLFESLAANAGRRTIAAVLTGMGSDGAAGLLALRHAGAMTFAQDEASSAVFGMAKAAVELGAVRRVLPLDVLGPSLARAARGVATARRTER
jgi:two-component system chemotaxis response regulator CheB